MNGSDSQIYTHLTEDIIRALSFAARAHEHQKRKDDHGTPYIAHPAGVGIILTKLGCREEVIIAGILHDVIEDTEFGYEDIEKEFNTEIADLVKWVSIPAGMPGKAGKIAYLENLEKAPDEARMISAADMLYNRADLIFAITSGQTILERHSFESYIDPEMTSRRLSLVAESLGQDHELVKDLKQQQELLADLMRAYGR